MEKIPVTLIIPTLNRPDSLANTLQSFFSCAYFPEQLVVVDQSDDEYFKKNSELLEKFYLICSTIHYRQKERSLTKARNNGIKLSTNEIVIYSDDDIIVNDNTLLNTYLMLQKNEVSLVGGINSNSQKSKSFIGYLLGFKSFKNRRIGHVTKSMFGRFPIKYFHETPTMWAMGYYFGIKKSLVSKWNISWDERLTGYAYAEDLDFTYTYFKESKKEGLKCIYSSDISVVHLNSFEFRTTSRKTTFMYVLNRAYLRKKHNMGFLSKIVFDFNNSIILLYKFFTKSNYKDYYDALKYLRKNKKTVYSGVFYYGE